MINIKTKKSYKIIKETPPTKELQEKMQFKEKRRQKRQLTQIIKHFLLFYQVHQDL